MEPVEELESGIVRDRNRGQLLRRAEQIVFNDKIFTRKGVIRHQVESRKSKGTVQCSNLLHSPSARLSRPQLVLLFILLQCHSEFIVYLPEHLQTAAAPYSSNSIVSKFSSKSGRLKTVSVMMQSLPSNNLGPSFEFAFRIEVDFE